ncbi:HAMP domain-containing histidine kinase [Alkalicella caledoniensis]|uniref:histidine kinase n=1 Tax=Alkalicella caledoniensis TaxID=2731377 RepID=A0A7G9W8P4_ALKCA|nr:HAMP domain-containing sensor histidine kinase [Alkalicella caledoniensis]QNO15056.1 HAMP domain-containing histidine kinase [Alkalicella caledoniensis]
MENLQKSSLEYLRQFFLRNNLTDDNFRTEGQLLVKELSNYFQYNVALYDSSGSFVYGATTEENDSYVLHYNESIQLKNSSKEDLLLALNNQSGFTINSLEGTYIVNYSYPLYLDNNYYGILRFSKDYSGLFNSSQFLLRGFSLVNIFVLALLFSVTYYVSLNIIRPLVAINKGLKQFSEGNYGLNVRVKTGDELEELSNSFNKMSTKIKKQVETILEEKDKVLKLEKNRIDFFNNVTHELKTPLTTISGYAQILEGEDFNDKAFLMRAAGKIKSESQRLHQMVVQLIELSKTESQNNQNKFTVIGLSSLLQSVGEDMQMKADKYQMKIQCTIEDDIKIIGSQNNLREIFINLIDNSIKYGVNNTDIYISSAKKGKIAEIQISNHSDVIDEGDIEKLFGPFYRANISSNMGEKGSSGLGLYICKKLVEQHKGSIDLENKDNITKIIVKFPLWQQLGNNLGKDGNNSWVS